MEPGRLCVTDPVIPALEIERLNIAYRVRGANRAVIRDLTLSIRPGEAYGLVGESGCGKSTVAFAAMRYLARNGSITDGTIRLGGRDVTTADRAELRHIRSSVAAMVYQDPGKALNPSIRVGRQLCEVFEIAGSDPEAARAQAAEMLARVRIVDPDSVMHRYPHELSGGMQQRVCIAMALAARPQLLILDEPTTGLDVTVEAEVLDLIATLRRETGMAILFISHNLAVVARLCERVGVLYAGTLVEEGPTDQVFGDPRHPYTLSLLRCLPKPGQRKDANALETIPGGLPTPGLSIAGCPFAPRCPLVQDICRRDRPELAPDAPHHARCHFQDEVPDLAARSLTPLATATAIDYAAPPLLSAHAVGKTFLAGQGRRVHALRDVTFDLWPGETLGVVGESGSGKTTLARVLLGLVPPDAGGVLTLDGAALNARLEARMSDQVRGVQIIFQNPDAALNRAHPVRRIVGRALHMLSGLKGEVLGARLAELLSAVRLPAGDIDARPRRLSGGLKQRVAIARAFAGEPRIVVCDEPTSALDVSVQAAILNLLVDLQRRRGTSYLFISHDLAVVRYLSDRIMVLYLGRIMEIGPVASLVAGPRHPYTDALLSVAPTLSAPLRAAPRLEGEMPSALDPPKGCVFHTRCPLRIDGLCDEEEPPLLERGQAHAMRCHLDSHALPHGDNAVFVAGTRGRATPQVSTAK